MLESNNKERKVKIAALLENYYNYACFNYECELIKLDTNSWKNILINERPDIVLVESIWGKDLNSFLRFNENKYKGVENIFDWCKANNIPTVFWNKEDPVSFNTFIGMAKNFQYIFTTDSDCIPKYKAAAGHENVYVLQHGVQIKIHNPIDRDNEKIGEVAFAGTWYAKCRPQRQKDMEILLDPCLKYGLDIYDRNYNLSSSNYEYPDKYKPFIKGALSYEMMAKVYKKYNVFLNVNTVRDSPTMQSRRVLEVLASGVNLISSYSRCVKENLKGIVKLVDTEEDTEKYLEILLNNKGLRDRLALLGEREVFNKHTYTHRIKEILGKVGTDILKKDEQGVSIIVPLNENTNLDNIFDDYNLQKHLKKEMLIVLNKSNKMLKELINKASSYDNVRIISTDNIKLMNEFINVGVSNSNYSFISIFDSNSYYAPDFVRDLMNAYKYSDSDIVGKSTFYSYSEVKNVLELRFINMEYRYVKTLCPAACIIKKEAVTLINFPENLNNEDEKCFEKCVENGVKLYSSDRFNFISYNDCFATDEASVNTYEIIRCDSNYKCYVTV